MVDTTQQYLAQLSAFDTATNNYIDQLLGQAQGDRDLAIKMLTRDHDLAIGSNDQQTAQFLERVSDSLEQRIGRIPYDYEIATKRTQEDLARTTEVTQRNKDLALQRLAQDEQTWRQEFGKTAGEARQTQSEELLKRGLLSGTRAGAEGLAGREVGKLEGELGSTLSAYERALGRSKEDVTREAGDVMFGAEREAGRTLEDLKTQARRGVIGAQDAFTFGKEAQERQLEARKRELERQKLAEQAMNLTRAYSGI